MMIGWGNLSSGVRDRAARPQAATTGPAHKSVDRARRAHRSLRVFAFAALGALAGTAAQADDPPYKGKTLRLIIGYGPGGGYDFYGRVFAEHFPKYLPGQPGFVVQNMPGAGSFVAAKYLYGVAPKDGTYMAIISQTFALDAVMSDEGATFDASKLPVIGRLVESVDVGIGMPGASFKTFADARKRQIVVASTGGSSPGYLMPAALSKFGGARFKIISGYAGSTEAELALQRGEAELAASVALLTVQQKYPQWLKDGAAPILYQSGLTRSPLLPSVPSLGELGTDAMGTKVLRAIGASSEIGKSVLTTPGISKENLNALRSAFNKMMNDPAFIETMKQRGIPMSFARGEDMEKLVIEVKNTPAQVIEALKSLTKT